MTSRNERAISLAEELRTSLDGEVRTDKATLCAYSVDASIYEIEPQVVVTPKNKQEVLKVLQIAAQHQTAISPRGAATGITGGCLTRGIVLDLSKYLNQILDINVDEKYVICEPGVVQDQLNASLKPFGYRLGPDTSTGNRATIGGMLANNSAGAHSLRYGRMSDHVIGVELALAGGSIVNIENLDAQQLKHVMQEPGLRSTLYREICRIRDEYRDDIAASFPNLPRRVSGYNLDELIKPGPLNAARLIAGSEGTLGIATAIKIGISPLLGKTGLCLIHFHDMIEGLRAIPNILEHQPVSLEMLDDKILAMARQSSSARDKLGWCQGEPSAVFAVEFEGEDIVPQLDSFCLHMKNAGIGYAWTLLTNPAEASQVWEVRKAGLGLLLSKRTYSRAIAFLEDLSIPPARLPDFIAQFKAYLSSHGKEAGIYGHVGAGCMHIRPYVDLRKPEELTLMQQMMLDVSSMVLEHGGALSGEHGDGLVRSWLNEKMFGPKVYQGFCELKAAFDPHNLLNPGKIVHGPALLENLRLNPTTPRIQIDTYQDFSPEGGFSLAVDLCNGNAQCRKGEGLMCPSFQVTRDEFDTTRSRAQALRAVINGRWKIDDFTSPDVARVMDLCLECKGCKKECPSQIDMAKMKAEFLYHYQEKHGYSLRNRLFGHLEDLYRLSSPFARMINWLAQTSSSKSLLSALGIAPERSLPLLVPQRFSSWLASQKSVRGQKVVLFSDTYTEFNQPLVGIDAYKLLGILGCEVLTPPRTCCGRPLISKGLLKHARHKSHLLVDNLYPYAEEGIPIIGLEPSCILTVADDIPTLVDVEMRDKARTVAKMCLTLDQFLHKYLIEKGYLPFSGKGKSVKVHGHCHQKALIGTKMIMDLLKTIPDLTVAEIPSGCCGMAGSFGYEKEHYELSMKIGSLHLFPTIKESDENTLIVADGFSCRNQILQGTGRKALHLSNLLIDLINY